VSDRGAATLPAGDFLSWLEVFRRALKEGGAVSVPCGDCNACCRASYFIHVQGNETRSLAAIPAPLLVRAPGMPGADKVLGYDRQGHCPMLADGACSIYPARPLTCRRYDCRVFAAAGILPEEPERRAVVERVRRWRFACPTRSDEDALAAVRAAASFLDSKRALFPEGFVPGNATQLAVLAVKVFDVFLDPNHAGRPARALAEEVVSAARRFERDTSGQSGD